MLKPGDYFKRKIAESLGRRLGMSDVIRSTSDFVHAIKTKGGVNTDPAKQIKKTIGAIQQAGENVQYLLEQANKETAQGFTKATKAFSMLDYKVVSKFDDMADLFDRLAYRQKNRFRRAGAGAAVGDAEFRRMMQGAGGEDAGGSNWIMDFLKDHALDLLEGAAGLYGVKKLRDLRRGLRGMRRGSAEKVPRRPGSRFGSHSTATKSHAKPGAKVAEKTIEDAAKKGIKAAGKETGSFAKWLKPWLKGGVKGLGTGSKALIGKGGAWGTGLGILGTLLFEVGADWAINKALPDDEKKKSDSDASPEHLKLENKELLFDIQHELKFEISKELVFDAQKIVWGNDVAQTTPATDAPKDKKPDKATAAQVLDFAKEAILPTPDLFGPDGKGTIPNPDTGTPGFGNFGNFLGGVWDKAKGLFGGGKAGGQHGAAPKGGGVKGKPEGGKPAPATPTPMPAIKPTEGAPYGKADSPTAVAQNMPGKAPGGGGGGGVVPKGEAGSGGGVPNLQLASLKSSGASSGDFPAMRGRFGNAGLSGGKAATPTPTPSNQDDGLTRLAAADTDTMTDATPIQLKTKMPEGKDGKPISDTPRTAQQDEKSWKRRITPRGEDKVDRPSDEIDAAVKEAAKIGGISVNDSRNMAFIESSFNPKNVTGTMSGLYQLSTKGKKPINNEWLRLGEKDKDVLDPMANARAYGGRVQEIRKWFKNKFGREPTGAEIYATHNQGQGIWSDTKQVAKSAFTANPFPETIGAKNNKEFREGLIEHYNKLHKQYEELYPRDSKQPDADGELESKKPDPAKIDPGGGRVERSVPKTEAQAPARTNVAQAQNTKPVEHEKPNDAGTRSSFTDSTGSGTMAMV